MNGRRGSNGRSSAWRLRLVSVVMMITTTISIIVLYRAVSGHSLPGVAELVTSTASDDPYEQHISMETCNRTCNMMMKERDLPPVQECPVCETILVETQCPPACVHAFQEHGTDCPSLPSLQPTSVPVVAPSPPEHKPLDSLLAAFPTLTEWSTKNELQDFKETLERVADHRRDIVFAPVAGFYLSMALNFASSRALRSNVLFLTASEEIMETLKEHGFACYDVSSWMDGWRTGKGLNLEGAYWVDAVKAFSTGIAAAYGYNVMVTGLDVFVMKYPFDHFCKDAAIEVSTDWGVGGLEWVDADQDKLEALSYNADMIYVSGTAAGVAVMDEWLKECVENPGAFTQGLLVSAINKMNSKRVMSAGPLAGGCKPDDEKRNMPITRLLNLRDFPMGPNVYFGVTADPVAVHYTGGMGKIYKMLEHGAWQSLSNIDTQKYVTYDNEDLVTIEDQVNAFRAALGIAKALGRVLIPPTFDCTMHRHADLFNERSRHVCSLDMVLNVAHFDNLNTEGKVSEGKEYVIMPHRLLSFRASRALTEARFGFVESEKGQHQPRGADVIIVDSGKGLTDTQWEKEMKPYQDKAILRFKSALGRFAGFSDPSTMADFEAQTHRTRRPVTADPLFVADHLLQMKLRLRPAVEWAATRWPEWLELGECVPGDPNPPPRVHNCRWAKNDWVCDVIDEEQLKDCVQIPSRDCPRWQCSSAQGSTANTTAQATIEEAEE